MELYDILMLVVVVGATIFGAIKGMAWQVASLASLVLSYFAALRFSGPLAPHFGREAPWNRFVAMLVIYLVVSLVIWLLFRLVSRFIDRVKLNEFDRQIGAIFGLAKGLCLCLAITLFAISLSSDAREAILRSRSGYYLAVLLDRAEGVMPRELHEILDPYLQRLERGLDPRVPSETVAGRR
jgi:membrane protein required for colicin V production